MSHYKAIIFDLGNVVFDYSFTEALKYWAHISNQDLAHLKTALDFDADELTHDLFEKAAITPKQFRDYVAKKMGYPLTMQEFEHGWNAIFKEKRTGIDELLVHLKRNYRIIALTNTNETHAHAWRVKYRDTLTHFEKIFASHEIKARKPKPVVFQACLAYLKTKPSETVFLDDKPVCVNGAEKLGITGIVVKSFEQMCAALTEIGIETADN